MMKKYRVIKEFFVDAHDEYDAETKAEDNKIKLPYNLIDVHEIDEKVIIKDHQYEINADGSETDIERYGKGEINEKKI